MNKKADVYPIKIFKSRNVNKLVIRIKEKILSFETKI